MNWRYCSSLWMKTFYLWSALFFVVLMAVYFLLPSHSILIISVLKIQGCTSWQTKLVYSHHIRSFMSALRGMLWYPFSFDYTDNSILQETHLKTNQTACGFLKCHAWLESNWKSYCLFHRNHGMGDTSIKFEVIPGKNQKSEYVMTCGKHTVRGWCEYPCLKKTLEHSSKNFSHCRLFTSHVAHTVTLDCR